MDKVLKQRLVGASILIALAVIFLPMLFNGGGDDTVEQRELALDAPERDSGDRRVRRLALDPQDARRPPGESRVEPPESTQPEPIERRLEPQPGEQETAAEPPSDDLSDDRVDSPVGEPSRDPAQGSPESEGEPGSDSESSELEPEAEPEQAESTPEQQVESAPSEPVSEAEGEPEAVPASSAQGRWVVQVAVFSNRDTADSIRQRLDELGHRATMDVLIRDQAELFRLRTGPYEDQSAASQARGQIAATVAGVDPVTRELSGQGDAEDRQGMSVQVGSFASRNNAERLVGQLTEAGFDAFMYGEDSGGRTIWRVRVGAHEERADAERLLETLREEQGLEGIVVSHP